jgi:MFS family permease
MGGLLLNCSGFKLAFYSCSAIPSLALILVLLRLNTVPQKPREAVAVDIPGGKLSDKIGRKPTILSGLVLSSAAIIPISFIILCSLSLIPGLIAVLSLYRDWHC